LGSDTASDYGRTADFNPNFEDETMLRGIPEETSSTANNGYITAEGFLKQFQGKPVSPLKN